MAGIAHYLILPYDIYIIGAEFVILYIMLFLMAHLWGRLTTYLQQNYLQFYQDNFEIAFPFLRSDKDIQVKRNKAFKTVWRGDMPDELSRAYQRKIRIYAKLTITCFIIPIITFVVDILLSKSSICKW